MSSTGFLGPIRRFLRTLVGTPPGADVSDEQLLHAFAAEHDVGAFKALLQKHGPMVLGVCRRVLGHAQDAEDAFQATFLVLARNAAAGFRPQVLGGWLYGVACRTAQKVRGQAAKRREKERQAARMPSVDPDSDAVWADLRPVLDEEINGLPEKYRVPFVLCYLQGKTNEQAAELLGCPKGTVLSRLAWARERLRARLVRRGLAPSAGALAAALSADCLSAAVPAALAELTAGNALRFAWGPVAWQATPDPVTALAEGVLTTMSRTKLANAVVLALVLGLLGTGAGVAAFYLQTADHPQGQAREPKAQVRSGERLHKLLEKRREIAREEFELRKKRFYNSFVNPDSHGIRLFTAAVHLFESEFALSKDRLARTAACKAHLSRMQEIGREYKRRYEVGMEGFTQAEAAMAEFYVLDAEIRLEQAEK
jgi:RNA polymerase sigma factor (sigma-70 family)